MRQALAICSLVGVLAVPSSVEAYIFEFPRWVSCMYRETRVKGGYTHSVQNGETLRGIAQRVYSSPAQYSLIARVNRIEDPDLIRPGQDLVLPEQQSVHFEPTRPIPCDYDNPGGPIVRVRQ